MTALPDLIAEADAAPMVKLSARQLANARRARLIPGHLLGRSWFYTLDDLARFVAASRQDNAPCRSTERQSRPAIPSKMGRVVPFSKMAHSLQG